MFSKRNRSQWRGTGRSGGTLYRTQPDQRDGAPGVATRSRSGLDRRVVRAGAGNAVHAGAIVLDHGGNHVAGRRGAAAVGACGGQGQSGAAGFHHRAVRQDQPDRTGTGSCPGARQRAAARGGRATDVAQAAALGGRLSSAHRRWQPLAGERKAPQTIAWVSGRGLARAVIGGLRPGYGDDRRSGAL